VSKAAKRERQRLNRMARREYQEQITKRRRRNKAVRGFLILAVPVIVIGVILSVVNSGSDETSTAVSCASVKTPPAKNQQFDAPPPQTIDPTQQYTATIKTTCGTIEVALASQQAPISVNNFVFLAEQHFYDDLAFIRAAKDFVIQTGSPTQTADGDPGYTIQGELPTATPPYPIGAVAFGKAGNDSAGMAGSQFFVVTGKHNTSLTPDYALIGTVTKGLAVAKKITSFAPSGGDGKPTTPVVMRSVTITPASSSTTTTTTTTSG
jgi:cyclophilin family peptidyl-prolyl cis-trans isomerase